MLYVHLLFGQLCTCIRGINGNRVVLESDKLNDLRVILVRSFPNDELSHLQWTNRKCLRGSSLPHLLSRCDYSQNIKIHVTM